VTNERLRKVTERLKDRRQKTGRRRRRRGIAVKTENRHAEGEPN